MVDAYAFDEWKHAIADYPIAFTEDEKNGIAEHKQDFTNNTWCVEQEGEFDFLDRPTELKSDELINSWKNIITKYNGTSDGLYTKVKNLLDFVIKNTNNQNFIILTFFRVLGVTQADAKDNINDSDLIAQIDSILPAAATSGKCLRKIRRLRKERTAYTLTITIIK